MLPSNVTNVSATAWSWQSVTGASSYCPSTMRFLENVMHEVVESLGRGPLQTPRGALGGVGEPEDDGLERLRLGTGITEALLVHLGDVLGTDLKKAPPARASSSCWRARR